MKKLIFTSLLLLAMSSCSKDNTNNRIDLESTNKTLYFEDKYKIVAESKDPINYTSSDEYHATVSGTGLVTAGRIGETSIILDNTHDTKVLKLHIKPKLVLYKDPYLEFGSTEWTVVNELGEPDEESSNSIAYNLNSDVAPLVMYTFDDYDRLEYVVVLANSLYTEDLADYLLERYIPVSIADLIFVNGLTPEETSMLVKLELFNTSYWMVVYASYTGSGTRSEADDVISIDEESIRSIVREHIL